MNRLLDIGFHCVGHWILENDQLVCQLDSLANQQNILYAFICDGEVKYIGKTGMKLRSRMYGYQNPGGSQRTNIRNNKLITDALRNDYAIDIFALPDHGLLQYGAFHMNMADGLERSLISTLNPQWNSQGTTTNTPSIDATVEPNVPQNMKAQENTDSNSKEEHTIPPSYTHINFTIKLGKTYYNTGFFNVGVDYERYFGNDRQGIEIYLGNNEVPVSGYINRAANKHNDTPRIMGGVPVRNWFKENFSLNEDVQIEVLSPVSIRILKISQ